MEKGKKNRFIISPEHFVPLNKSSSQETTLPEPNHVGKGKYQTLAFPKSDMGEENYPIPALSSLPVSPKHLRRSQPRGTDSFKNRDLIIGHRMLPQHINRAPV